MRIEIAELLKGEKTDIEITVMGWVRTFRNNQFIALNDGSTNNNLQVVVDFNTMDETILKRITTSACISASGKLIKSQGKGQTVELVADSVEILGDSDAEKYPLQPKKHSLEFLREIAHLRFRTNTFGSVFRLRNALIFGIHKFFQEQNFLNIHSPIISASDAEGAGEMFRVTTLDLNKLPKTEQGETDFSQDFFGRSSNLTVSGQLEAELAAMAFTKVYTFGPTFRAENSNTARHLAEFWMIEPEVAFNDLKDNADLAENMLKYVIRYAMEKHPDDIDFLDARLAEEEKQKPTNERAEFGLKEKLNFMLENNFERVTYTEAIEILLQSPAYKKKKFQYEVNWGIDMQSEHERWLTEKQFKQPIIVFDYPKDIKAFYMRLNEDGKTVRAMDVLVPRVGEIIGGSQREDRLEVLEARMRESNLEPEAYWWYLDLRRYGSVPHSGFGLGLERLVQMVTGMANIRDVIPFPRTPQSADF